MLRRANLILLLLLPCTFTFGQAPTEGRSDDLDTMMSSAMKMTSPLPEHDLLRRLAGEWTYVIEMTMPGTPTMRGSGKTSIREILGGRFIELRSESTGKSGFENMMLLGYDSRKDRQDYFLLGVDSLGHYYVDLRGDWNEKTATLTLHGEEYDPNVGQLIPYRQVFRFPGTDTMTCDIFMDMPGARDPLRMVGIVYQRASGDDDQKGGTRGLLAGKQGSGSLLSGRKTVPPTSFSADDIEAMDRTELQSALMRIMRARSMGDIESASKADLDGQYSAALARMRSLRAESAAASNLTGGETGSGEIPSYGDELIGNMSVAEARAALTQIVTARRIPGLSAEQRDELSGAFTKILGHLSKQAGAGVAKRQLESIEREQERESEQD